MKLDQATKNYLYYFKKTGRPIIWVLGVDLSEAETAAKSIYSRGDDWFTADSRLVDVLADRKGEDMPGNKRLGVDMMLVDTDAAPIKFLREFLEKSKVYVVKTDVPGEIKDIFRAKDLTLVDEIDEGEGSVQQTWVRSNTRRA